MILPKTFDSLFQKVSRNSNIFRNFLRLCDMLNERECTTNQRLLEKSLSTLEEFLKELSITDNTLQRRQYVAETNATNSEFKKKTLKCQNSVPCIFYACDPTKKPQTQFLECASYEVFHCKERKEVSHTTSRPKVGRRLVLNLSGLLNPVSMYQFLEKRKKKMGFCVF